MGKEKKQKMHVHDALVGWPPDSRKQKVKLVFIKMKRSLKDETCNSIKKGANLGWSTTYSWFRTEVLWHATGYKGQQTIQPFCPIHCTCVWLLNRELLFCLEATEPFSRNELWFFCFCFKCYIMFKIMPCHNRKILLVDGGANSWMSRFYFFFSIFFFIGSF